VYHEIQGAVVVGKVGRGGNDVVDFVQLADTAFGGIEGDNRATCVYNGMLNLSDGLVVMLPPGERVLLPGECALPTVRWG